VAAVFAVGLLLPFLLLRMAALGATEPALWLADETRAFGCREVQGEFVVLVSPQWGALALAARPFSGAERVGAIEGSQLRFSVPGLRMRELRAESKAIAGNGPLWGMLVKPVDLPPRPGCFGLDGIRGADAAQLQARLQQVTAEVFVPFQEELTSDAAGPRFTNRQVTFEVLAAGSPWRRMVVREAEPVDLPPHGNPRRYRVAAVLTAGGDQVLLLVSGSSRQVRRLEVGHGDAVLDDMPALRVRIKSVS